MAGRQNNSTDSEAGVSIKKCRRVYAGQKIELEILGSRMTRPSQCSWPMNTKKCTGHSKALMSQKVRWSSGVEGSG